MAKRTDTESHRSVSPAPAIAGLCLLTIVLSAGPAGAQSAPLNAVELPAERIAELAAGDAEAGRITIQRCAACHSLDGPDEYPRTGPTLFGIVGAPVAWAAGFDYSPAMTALGDRGLTWTPERLDVFLADPAAALPGTAMTAGATEDPEDRANIIAYLQTRNAEAMAAEAARELALRIAAADPETGERLAARCADCHTFATGGEALVGPNLFDIVGAPVARAEGFAYSIAFRSLNVVGATWTVERLDAFLANPADEIPGTRMGFAGVADEGQRAAIIAYLRQLSEDPLPLPGDAGTGQALRGVFQEGLDPLRFTTTQVQFGDRYYTQVGCDRCHGGNLAGLQDSEAGAPALIGRQFAENWFESNVYALYRYIETEMPFEFDRSNRGIDDDFLLTIVAFLLERNGFAAGEQPLPADRAGMEAIGFYQ